MTAMHRVEQPRHQSQPLALSFLVMTQDVLRHAVPDALYDASSEGARLLWASLAGCSTSARTRLAMNLALRTGSPVRVTSATSTMPRPRCDLDPATRACRDDLICPRAIVRRHNNFHAVAFHGASVLRLR